MEVCCLFVGILLYFILGGDLEFALLIKTHSNWEELVTLLKYYCLWVMNIQRYIHREYKRLFPWAPNSEKGGSRSFPLKQLFSDT